ncbi:putative reductase [compost metagenome]
MDEQGRIRIDDWELREDVQAEVAQIWEQISTENINQLADLEGYRREFYQLFGFEVDHIDYDADVNPEVQVLHSL